MADGADLWHKHATLWRHIGQPLRPTPHDTHVMERFVARCQVAAQRGTLNALMLGVTVEIAGMQWPTGTQLLALDRSWPMVTGIWPGDNPSRRVVVGDWFRPPIQTGTCDLIAADGALNMLHAAAAYAPGLEVLHGLLRTNGHMVMRTFVRPDSGETADEVFAALFDGGIGNFHIFKFRLAMAMQRNFESGVARDAVWRAWNEQRVTATRAATSLK